MIVIHPFCVQILISDGKKSDYFIVRFILKPRIQLTELCKHSNTMTGIGVVLRKDVNNCPMISLHHLSIEIRIHVSRID